VEPIFFPTPADFRAWLEQNHSTEKELIVGFYRKASGKPSITWSEAVDQALCFGWIDGVRHSRDHESYTNRFTPRRPGSNWSAVNIRKVEQLAGAGLNRRAGGAVPGAPRGVGVLPVPGPLLPADRHLVGGQREARGDEGQTAGHTHRGLGQRTADRAHGTAQAGG
jgi:hypothetical protein